MPSCVYACPHDAARRVDPTHYFSTSFAATARWQPAKFKKRTTHDMDHDSLTHQ
jgi:hypothetical protein